MQQQNPVEGAPDNGRGIWMHCPVEAILMPTGSWSRFPGMGTDMKSRPADNIII
jgi:hypothetical protein